MSNIHVYSEIGKLKKVLLHRPDNEIDGVIPQTMPRHLFDDIPWKKGAQREHDCFADILRKEGAEVVYIEDLFRKSFSQKGSREGFIKKFLDKHGIFNPHLREQLEAYLLCLSPEEMADKIMSGIKKSDLGPKKQEDFSRFFPEEEYEHYYTEPLANLYYTRDPGASIGRGMSFHCMEKLGRNLETVVWQHIFEHHPDFAKDAPMWLSNESHFGIEGGDIAVFSKDVIGIGCGLRTRPEAIEQLAGNILPQDTFKKILVFTIPKDRKFMHLDTVLTMIDHDKFTIHPGIEATLNVFEISLGGSGELVYKDQTDKVEKVLTKALNLDSVQVLRCADGSFIDSEREQWNDGTNTLAIAPGTVVTYSRNEVTNELLRRSGIKVLEMPCGELSRGRGGPRCMSMPLVREDI
ncbi:MAG: arginine deiminase [Firmicutes bacterium]|jgi:arginine deiminase|nr:arginine deiminase [Bacillota bacterium]